MDCDLDFDIELEKDSRPYDHRVGTWWQSQASNRSHRSAYRKISDHICLQIQRGHPVVVDYACGTGKMFERFLRCNPNVKVVGIDGSSSLLAKAEERMKSLPSHIRDRTRFIRSDLPDFSLTVKADVVVLCFPHIVPTTEDLYNSQILDKHERELAEQLSLAIESDSEDDVLGHDSEALYQSLLHNRVVSKNLRNLLKVGGYCFRIEYANGRWDELSELSRQRSVFEAGSLDAAVDGNEEIEQFFRPVCIKYFRSGVIQDVFHQTKNSDDTKGGYWITLLEAT